MATGRNYDRLAAEHPYSFDDAIVFNEEQHSYTVNGIRVPRSVTKVIASQVDEQPFDADFVIAKNLSSWRSKPHTEYGSIVQGKTDAEAKEFIKTLWNDTTRLGTNLHRRFEAALNGVEEAPDGETDLEFKLLQAELDCLRTEGWTPLRSELSMWWQRKDEVVCAGQLDALFEDGTASSFGRFETYEARPLTRTQNSVHQRVPQGSARRVLRQRLYKYSLQQSCYAVMFKQRTGRSIAPTNGFCCKSIPNSIVSCGISAMTLTWKHTAPRRALDFDVAHRGVVKRLGPGLGKEAERAHGAEVRAHEKLFNR